MKNHLLKKGAGKSSEIRGALGDASFGSLCLSVHSFLCASFFCPPPSAPTHPPMYSSTPSYPQWSLCLCLLCSLHSSVASSLSIPYLLLSPIAAVSGHFCSLMPSACLALISLILLVSAGNKFVSSFGFHVAGSPLMFFCAMSTCLCFLSKGLCTEQVLAQRKGWLNSIP